MGSDYSAFLYDQLFVKEPQTKEDRPYWAVTGEHICSVWVPLDPVKKETVGGFPSFVSDSRTTFIFVGTFQSNT
jgi:hypothetical protein